MTGPTLYLGPQLAHISGVYAGDRNLHHVFVVENGVPVDLTGQQARAQARGKATDEGPAPIEAVIEIVDAVGGHLQLTWPGEDVRAMLAGQATFKGVWDLQITSGDGPPQTLVKGTFKADMDVTR
jgi:hypothetical protein